MTPKQRAEFYKFLTSKIGWDEMSEETQTKVFKKYESIMPYGTAKARTGDPDQWIYTHVNYIAEKAARRAFEEGKSKREIDNTYRLALAEEINSI